MRFIITQKCDDIIFLDFWSFCPVCGALAWPVSVSEGLEAGFQISAWEGRKCESGQDTHQIRSKEERSFIAFV